MGSLKITPDGAKVLRNMIVSCGSLGCTEAVDLLEAVKKTAPLDPIALDGAGCWRMKAFERLYGFAHEKNLALVDAYEVAWYFGGRNHIDIMVRYAGMAGLGEYLGPDVGLVTHILLPLNKAEEYRNLGKTLSFGSSFHPNSDDKRVPCYHLGVIVNIPLTEEQVETILAEQAEHPDFARAFSRIKGPVVLPEGYLKALSCNVRR